MVGSSCVLYFLLILNPESEEEDCSGIERTQENERSCRDSFQRRGVHDGIIVVANASS